MRIELQGMEALMQNILNLPLEEAEENKALNAAAKIVKEAVIEEAPEDDGTLKKNIKAKRAKDGEAKVHTGAAYHSHIVEFGRSAGSKYALKNGKRQLVTWGATAPNPFFTRGLEKSKPAAIDKMAEEIKKAKKL
ncbi:MULTISPECIES: HK97-gp10 family putative phage morphogenesis protein [unclassified Lysinibacillus]|uniref:HK97-gp10 family putative phage morphogenesis protein n=1 Tax=unclassified Lysinibacillus TaxID=2636778 RepID=UPI003826F676